jgi:hypothetical protein
MPQAAGQRNPDPLTGGAGLFENPAMAEKETRPDARKARLARALKANIARRKAQAKDRQEKPQPPEPPSEPPPEEDHCRN